MHKRTILGIILLVSPLIVAVTCVLIATNTEPEGPLLIIIAVINAALEILLCCPSVLLIISGISKSKGIKRVNQENPDFNGYVSERELESKKTRKRGQKQPKAKKQKKQKKERKSSGDVEFTF